MFPNVEFIPNNLTISNFEVATVLKVSTSRKKNCRAVTSSKKQTKCTQHTMYLECVSFFLEEAMARQFCFDIN